MPARIVACLISRGTEHVTHPTLCPVSPTDGAYAHHAPGNCREHFPTDQEFAPTTRTSQEGYAVTTGPTRTWNPCVAQGAIDRHRIGWRLSEDRERKCNW